MNIIGIETSCDETAAAVVKDGREVLSNVVYTQIPLHQPYGGVVPEIASRAHIEKISQVIGSALDSLTPLLAHSPNRIDAVAVTYGPGLAPALIVGLNAAKGLAKSLGVPLIAVNHIEAHLHSPFIYDSPDDAAARLSDPREIGPMLGLAVSGGNTVWIDMPEYGKYEVIGETLDDAAGEAFDKAAKLLGLGYPGGLKIDRISAAYRERFPNEPLVPFPKGRPRDGVTALAGLPAELCVSFSGLKTALLRHVQHNPSLVESQEGAQDFGGFVYMLPLSVSMSMTILIGIEAGARRWINAEQYANVGLAFNWTCALILPSLCFLLRYSIAGMYVTEPEVIGVCVRFIAYSCLFIMGDAVAAPIQGILRGYKDVNAPFYSSLIAYWAICMPLGLFLDYRLGHGPYSYWQSLDIGLFFSALILLLRLKYVRKKMREEE